MDPAQVGKCWVENWEKPIANHSCILSGNSFVYYAAMFSLVSLSEEVQMENPSPNLQQS